MTLDDVCAFELPPIADDALLFLWRVAAMQEEALRVMRAWGFIPKSEIVWVKTHEQKDGGVQPFGATGVGLSIGMGHYTRQSHEVCLIGRRGRGVVRDRSIRSVIFAPRARHSEKPALFFQQVEKLCDGPRLELFGRRRRAGWDVVGDEVPAAPKPVMPRLRGKGRAA
jgi:N6-adenosine-specific RNA methylase IME4